MMEFPPSQLAQIFYSFAILRINPGHYSRQWMQSFASTCAEKYGKFAERDVERIIHSMRLLEIEEPYVLFPIDRWWLRVANSFNKSTILHTLSRDDLIFIISACTRVKMGDQETIERLWKEFAVTRKIQCLP